ncbi:trichohyalin [Iris pallida]|uniref:Trichohyalin n=1 Tax=Iris pallida TaxID=29817 RepID=A0AAX6DN28_IRIPA|nr:trichohyalin [Iris pallida]
MTAEEAGESNGGRRGGDPEAAEEIGGSYVIVNGGGEHSSEEDPDLLGRKEKKGSADHEIRTATEEENGDGEPEDPSGAAEENGGGGESSTLSSGLAEKEADVASAVERSAATDVEASGSSGDQVQAKMENVGYAIKSAFTNDDDAKEVMVMDGATEENGEKEDGDQAVEISAADAAIEQEKGVEVDNGKLKTADAEEETACDAVVVDEVQKDGTTEAKTGSGSVTTIESQQSELKIAPELKIAAVKTENRGESEVEDVKELEAEFIVKVEEVVKDSEPVTVSESVEAAVEETGNAELVEPDKEVKEVQPRPRPEDPVDSELVPEAEVKEGYKDDSLEAETKVEVQEPEIVSVESEDRGETELPAKVEDVKESDNEISVNESELVIVSESLEPVAEETGNAVVESTAGVGVESRQQPQDPVTEDYKVDVEDVKESEIGVRLEDPDVKELESVIVPESVVPVVEEIENVELVSAAEVEVESRQQPEDPVAKDDKVEVEERKEPNSVLEDTAAEETNTKEFMSEEENREDPTSVIEKADNLTITRSPEPESVVSDSDRIEVDQEKEPETSDEALVTATVVEPTDVVVIESTTSKCLPVENEVEEKTNVESDTPTDEQSVQLENEATYVCEDVAGVSTKKGDGPKDGALCECPKDDDIEPSHGQAAAAETIQAPSETHVVKRHPVYLIKVGRFIDDELEKKIQQAVLELNEKSRIRDYIREEIRKKLVTLRQYEQELEDASVKENKHRAIFNAKHGEVDGVQLLVNRINTATSIADIDEKIQTMVHRQQHETIDLKQEKHYIREINQLKRLREQLSVKKVPQKEIDEALGQKVEVYTHLEILKKELKPLRDVLKSAKNSHYEVWKRMLGEKDLLNKLREQYVVANGIRQEAYRNLQELRNQSAEKFKHFSMYKADQNIAANFRFSGDNEGLLSHCSRQVERIMELWNNNGDFRRDYIKSNVNSTLRRFGTLDGRSLVPGEEAPTVSSYVDRKPRVLSQTSSNIEVSAPLATSEGKQETSAHLVALGGKQEKSEALATKQVARTNHLVKSSAKSINKEVALTISPSSEPQKDEKETEVEELVKKEEELARKEEKLRKEMAAKEEDLRKEKAAAELKEKLILEQKIKAKEAEERKRRKSERARAKADQKAQKEAELKDKKKAKKEMKKAYGSEARNDVERRTTPVTDTTSSETSVPQETETTVASTSKRRSSRPAVAVKQYDRVQPLPFPLRNRGKRKMTTWIWVILTALLVLLLFFAGNYLHF